LSLGFSCLPVDDDLDQLLAHVDPSTLEVVLVEDGRRRLSVLLHEHAFDKARIEQGLRNQASVFLTQQRREVKNTE
jgi:hypothetical protein